MGGLTVGGLILKPTAVERSFVSKFTNPTSNLAYFQANNDVYDNTSIPNFDFEFYLILNSSVASAGIFTHGNLFSGTSSFSYQVWFSGVSLRFKASDISNNEIFSIQNNITIGQEIKVNIIADNGFAAIKVNDSIVVSDTYLGDIDYSRGSLLKHVTVGGRINDTFAPNASIDEIKITNLDNSEVVLNIPKVYTGKDEVTGATDQVVDITQEVRP